MNGIFCSTKRLFREVQVW